MIKRHTKLYVDSIAPMQLCGKTVGYNLKLNGAFEMPFEIKPTEGDHDFTKCNGCKKSLATIIESLNEKFDGDGRKNGFPLCCSFHSNLCKVKGFNRALYANAPVLAANKIIYTNQHVINNHGSENWYKSITDYIEWAVESFGQMPNDCGEPLFLSDYFSYVSHLIKGNDEIKAETKNRLLEYLDKYQTPTDSPKTDFNILLSTYQKWLKEFPFDLNSYFGDIKQHFEKQLPLFSGKPETNIYSGMAKVNIHTKGSLIEALVDITRELLGKINAREMLERGVISNLNKHRFELEGESLKIATSQITGAFSKGELQYIKALKKWLRLHREYFERIAPMLNTSTPQQTEAEKPEFKNTFDNIAEAEVYGHFKAGLVEKGYLSEPELNMFLKAAFELKQIPEALFKIKNAPKKAVIEAVFYQYYKNVAGKPHGKQPQYAALLGDYFGGYKTTTVSTNFSKSVY